MVDLLSVKEGDAKMKIDTFIPVLEMVSSLLERRRLCRQSFTHLIWLQLK